MEKEKGINLSGQGSLIPSNTFYEWILPYFEREDLWNYPLILSSIGRWAGEEDEVMAVARSSGHTIRAAVELRLSEQDVVERWEAAKLLGDRLLVSVPANLSRDQVFAKVVEALANFSKRTHNFSPVL